MARLYLKSSDIRHQPDVDDIALSEIYNNKKIHVKSILIFYQEEFSMN
ncbi:hypothetical protein COO91_07155 [Nostoc flagelliforme CCNUN1]|uniref:Uncharacterized protein n=1 Tax=Nostoc flagelliforme CCNUN1 TaxID=2038116 RepID=A0A2K8T095_9NOSO|nr:hypothetical protein COO91_07155 [Nostoc flagelliforme CCNUN1]